MPVSVIYMRQLADEAHMTHMKHVVVGESRRRHANRRGLSKGRAASTAGAPRAEHPRGPFVLSERHEPPGFDVGLPRQTRPKH